jgi:hypothetical protein
MVRSRPLPWGRSTLHQYASTGSLWRRKTTSSDVNWKVSIASSHNADLRHDMAAVARRTTSRPR